MTRSTFVVRGWGRAEEESCPADLEATMAVQAQVRAGAGRPPPAAPSVAK